MRVVNLSSRPFVNERPVVRLSVVLWVVGGLLLAVNIYSYSTYWYDSEEIRGEVSELRRKIDREETDLAELTGNASAVDVGELNAHAVFLNNLIRYRTFPWSRLFGELEEVLPKEVRLTSVHPVVERQTDVEEVRRTTSRSSRSRRSSRDAPPRPPVVAPEPENVQEIPMNLRGYAKSDEVILDFVDTLFEHPSFREPNFKRESLNEPSQEVAFEMEVIFLLEREADGEAGDDGAVEQVAESDEAADSSGAAPEESAPSEDPDGDGEPAAIVSRTFTGDEPPAGQEEESLPQAASGRSAGADESPAGKGKEGRATLRRSLTSMLRDARGENPADTPPGGLPPDIQVLDPPDPLPGDPPPSAGVEGDFAGSAAGAFPAVPPPSAGASGSSATDPPPGVKPPPSSGARPAGRPDGDEPGGRPRFVEPNASGTATIFPGGLY